MERIELDKVTPLLRAEHAHRYRWAASLARGRVLDAACGVGYGAPIITASGAVSTYTGLDRANEALAIANHDFDSSGRAFIKGDVYSLPFADASFDTVVSLETIEHLEHPDRALAEFKRVLAPGGVLLGSVPSKVFEEACRDAYGANEFHKSEFDDDDLDRLIHAAFEHSILWDCWLQMVSVLDLRHKTGTTWSVDAAAPPMTRLGSILFAATSSHERLSQVDSMPATVVYPATSVVEHERLTIRWRDRAIRNQEKLINERNELISKMETRLASLVPIEAQLRKDMAELTSKYDARLKDYAAAMAKQTQMIDERVALIKKQDALVATRDATIQQHSKTIANVTSERDALRQRLAAAESLSVSLQDNLASQIAAQHKVSEELARTRTLLAESQNLIKHQADLIDKRTAHLKQQEIMIAERDAAIRNQTRLIQERDLAIRNQTKMIDDRDAAIKSQTAMIDARDGWIRNLRSEIAVLKADLERQKSWSGSLEVTLAERDLSLMQMEERLNLREHLLADAVTRYTTLERDLDRPLFCLRRTARAMTKRVTPRKTESGSPNGEAAR